MSCSQDRAGAGTDGLLTLVVRSFIEDTQPKNGHLRQNKRLCKSAIGIVSYYSE